ncbi:hypothetical protein BHE74_00055474 [Ensete ventricosum]|nr:hypothetical protein BHE74_00055474 [Ensete ventricosum]
MRTRAEQGTSCLVRQSSPKGMVVSETSSGKNVKRKRQELDHVGSWVLHSDGANSSCMVPKMKGVSRHMHLISEMHLTEELRELDCSSAYIRLRELDKSEDKAKGKAMDSRAMGWQLHGTAEGWPKSSPCIGSMRLGTRQGVSGACRGYQEFARMVQESSLGWCKRVRQKKTETRRKIVGVSRKACRDERRVYHPGWAVEPSVPRNLGTFSG